LATSAMKVTHTYPLVAMHGVIHKQGSEYRYASIKCKSTSPIWGGHTFGQVLFGHHYCSLLSSKVPCSTTEDRHGIICMEA